MAKACAIEFTANMKTLKFSEKRPENLQELTFSKIWSSLANLFDLNVSVVFNIHKNH